MKVKEYLINKKEVMPSWLSSYKVGDKINIKNVLYKNRLVYYPGAFIDGQAIRTFNQCHYAHTYLYVDYGPSKEETYKELVSTNAIKGYKLLDIREINKNEICFPWTPHHRPTNEQIEWTKSVAKHAPYCYLAIYERLPQYGDDHGAFRFALLYLYADGIATYDALFANQNKAPEVLIIQDHGFGGNWDHFGRGGSLNTIANITNTFPHFIMCEASDNVWDGYSKIFGLEPEMGGMHGNLRFLFEKK